MARPTSTLMKMTPRKAATQHRKSNLLTFHRYMACWCSNNEDTATTMMDPRMLVGTRANWDVRKIRTKPTVQPQKNWAAGVFAPKEVVAEKGRYSWVPNPHAWCYLLTWNPTPTCVVVDGRAREGAGCGVAVRHGPSKVGKTQPSNFAVEVQLIAIQLG